MSSEEMCHKSPIINKTKKKQLYATLKKQKKTKNKTKTKNKLKTKKKKQQKNKK